MSVIETTPYAEEEENENIEKLLVPRQTRVSVRGDGWRACAWPQPVVVLPTGKPRESKHLYRGDD